MSAHTPARALRRGPSVTPFLRRVARYALVGQSPAAVRAYVIKLKAQYEQMSPSEQEGFKQHNERLLDLSG